MAEQASQLTFVTDDVLAKRLKQLEQGLWDLSARIPAMAREAAAIRAELEPGATPAPAQPPTAGAGGPPAAADG